MRSNEIPNQYNLIGENTPMWLVLGLVLVGTIGSVATTHLLLPPDLTMDTLESWATRSDHKERAAKPPPLVVSTTDVSIDISGDTSIAAPTQNTKTESADPIGEESRIAEESEHEGDSSRVSPDTAVVPMSPMSGEEISAQAKSESEGSGVTKITDGDRESAPMTPVSISTNAGTAVDFATNHAVETATAAADQTRDCAPLFDVQFKRGGVHPIDRDLGEKATRLSEWLRLHPDTELLLEGHTDSSGSEEFNLLISHRRAKAVSAILASAGVNSKQMATRALGEYSPLEGLPHGSEGNRRVSLRVEGAQACPQAISEGDTR